MRATKDTRQHLDLVLEELIHNHTEEKVMTYRANVYYVKDQYTSFVWGLYHLLSTADKNVIRANQGHTLQDQHIETALKEALKEYKHLSTL